MTNYRSVTRPRRSYVPRRDVVTPPLLNYEPPQYFFGCEEKRLEWYQKNRPNQTDSLLPNADTVAVLRSSIRGFPPTSPLAPVVRDAELQAEYDEARGEQSLESFVNGLNEADNDSDSDAGYPDEDQDYKDFVQEADNQARIDAAAAAAARNDGAGVRADDVNNRALNSANVGAVMSPASALRGNISDQPPHLQEQHFIDTIKARAMAMTVNEYRLPILDTKSRFEKKPDECHVMKHLRKPPVPIVLEDREAN